MIEDAATEGIQRIDKTLVVNPVIRRRAQIIMIVNKTTTEELQFRSLLFFR